MDIGKKIRALRVQKGLTQEELADRSELSKGFISQLENDGLLTFHKNEFNIRRAESSFEK